MKNAWRTVIGVGILTVGLTACTNPGGTEPTATPTPTPVAVCPVGNWQSTQVSAGGTAVGLSVTAQGGSGVKVTIAADGAVTADFTGMQPIVYDAQIAGAQVKGEFLYQGPISGAVSLPGASPSLPASPSPAMATTTAPAATTAASTATASPGTTPTAAGGAIGPWTPTGQVDWSQLGLTIRVTQPISVTIAENVKIGQITGTQSTQAGNAVDLQPLLRTGEFRCEGNDRLIITPTESGPTVTWTLARA